MRTAHVLGQVTERQRPRQAILQHSNARAQRLHNGALPAVTIFLAAAQLLCKGLQPLHLVVLQSIG